MFAQIQVSGVVKDADGEPLPGAYVESASGESVETDIDGKYTITANQGEELTFSFIGMDDKVQTVSGNSMNITLGAGEGNEIEQVVLTALGTERKKDDDLTGSTVVQTDVLQRSGESGVLQGLAGKSSGVRITKNSGDPGTGAFIQIRGQNSILGSNQPLIIVDGVIVSNTDTRGGATDFATDGVSQQSRLNDINPDDIEDMTVLKSAAATAIYGTSAANGAIIIKTKSGKSGKRGWKGDVSLAYTMDEINEKWDKQSTFGQGYNGNYLNNSPTGSGFFAGTSWGDKISLRSGGADGVDTSGQYFEAADGTRYYPYAVNADGTLQKNSTATYNGSNEDQIFRNNGSTKNVGLGLSYAGEDSNTYIGISNWDQEGVVRGSDYSRSTFRLNNTTAVTDKLTFSIATNYTYSSSNRIQQGSNLSGLYLGYLRTPADFDNSDYIGTYYDAAGNANLNRQRGFRNFLGSSNPAYNNPGWTLNQQKNTAKVNRFIISPKLIYKINDHLTASATYGVDYYYDKRETFFPTNSAGDFPNGMYRRDDINEKIETVNANISGVHTLSEGIGLNWTAGYMLENNKFERLSGQSQNFLNTFPDFDTYKGFGNATAENTIADQYTEQVKKHAFYGVVGLDLFDQVLMEFTGRFESPSTLPNETLFFPSAAIGWKFSENIESDIISFGKIRATYGEVAVEPSPYLTTSVYDLAEVGSSWGDTLDGVQYGGTFEESNVKPNPNIKEERIKEYELGLDLKLFKNRFSINTTYFHRRTEDAIVRQTLAPASGYEFKYTNDATLTNKGIEIDFDGTIIRNSNFNWKIFGNFSSIRNDVKMTNNGDVFLDGFSGTSAVAINGSPMSALYGGAWARDTSGNIILDANGFASAGTEDQVIGDPNPDWTGAIGTEFNFKGITLSALVETSQGNQVWNGTKGVLYFFGVHPDTANEITVSAADAATIINVDGTTINNLSYARQNSDGTYTVRGNLHDFGAGNVLLDQEWYTGTGGGFGPVAEQFVEDGSWVKLREISLGYELPSKLVGRIGLRNVSIGVTGRNLVTWTEVDGFDPESNLTGAGKGRGLEYFTNPSTRSYLFNVKIGF